VVPEEAAVVEVAQHVVAAVAVPQCHVLLAAALAPQCRAHPVVALDHQYRDLQVAVRVLLPRDPRFRDRRLPGHPRRVGPAFRGQLPRRGQRHPLDRHRPLDPALRLGLVSVGLRLPRRGPVDNSRE